MTRGELTKLLHQPHLIGDKEIDSLNHLISRYPYCQTFHILKTKGMHNVQSLGYMDQLKLTAITVSDRKNLYELIMRQSLLKQIEEVEKTSDKISVLPVKNEVAEIIPEIKVPVEEPIKQIEIIEEQPILQAPEPTEIVEEKKTVSLTEGIKEKVKFETYFVPQTPIYLQEEKKESHTEMNITSNVSKTVPLEEMKFAIKSEKSIVPEKINIEEEKKPISESKKISGLEQEILYEAINKSIQNEVWNDIVEENPNINEHREEVKLFSTNDDQPKDFYSWLHLNDTVKKETKITPSPSTEIEEKEHPSVIPTGQVKNLDDLIDKFIRSDPRITPSKAEFYSPTNIAKLSIVDQEDFVSETLAKIYEKQGYFDKAIKVYQKLSLKFPEKNSYFASLIEKTELQKAIEKQKKQK
jgi:hypothetical protein